jgi:hypothetical protein
MPIVQIKTITGKKEPFEYEDGVTSVQDCLNWLQEKTGLSDQHVLVSLTNEDNVVVDLIEAGISAAQYKLMCQGKVLVNDEVH